MKRTSLAFFLILALSSTSCLAQVTVEMFKLNKKEMDMGVGDSVGQITLEQTIYGLMIKTNIKGLSVGEHGFHVHENPSCEGAYVNGEYIPGSKAGGHYDPLGRHKHKGPYDVQGHLGDLPQLCVSADGECHVTLVAPRLKLKNVKGHSLVIHEHGDNYSDSPKQLGGGGARVMCGVVE